MHLDTTNIKGKSVANLKFESRIRKKTIFLFRNLDRSFIPFYLDDIQ